MKTRIIEATSDQIFWSTFLVGVFDMERRYKSCVDGSMVLRSYSPRDIFILDIQTREGAVFAPHGLADVDIERTAIYTGPLFKAFLHWIRAQFREGLSLNDLPKHVEVPLTEAQEAQRQEGPMTAFLRQCLSSSDQDVVANARQIWSAMHGVHPPGIPSTRELREWLDGFDPEQH